MGRLPFITPTSGDRGGGDGKGANGFLNKPFTDRQLNEAIAELMR